MVRRNVQTFPEERQWENQIEYFTVLDYFNLKVQDQICII